MDSILVDTGVWYALCDSRDSNYRKAEEKVELLSVLNVVVPWPTVYETLRIRFVKNAPALGRFERLLKSPNVKFLGDEQYRVAAFERSLDSSLRESRPLSMVDCLIRLILNDDNTNVRYLAAFNARDFFDVCDRKRVEMI